MKLIQTYNFFVQSLHVLIIKKLITKLPKMEFTQRNLILNLDKCLNVTVVIIVLSSTGYSGLFKKHGSFKEYETVAFIISSGSSVEQIADVLERDHRTIIQWLSFNGFQ